MYAALNLVCSKYDRRVVAVAFSVLATASQRCDTPEFPMILCRLADHLTGHECFPINDVIALLARVVMFELTCSDSIRRCQAAKVVWKLTENMIGDQGEYITCLDRLLEIVEEGWKQCEGTEQSAEFKYATAALNRLKHFNDEIESVEERLHDATLEQRGGTASHLLPPSPPLVYAPRLPAASTLQTSRSSGQNFAARSTDVTAATATAVAATTTTIAPPIVSLSSSQLEEIKARCKAEKIVHIAVFIDNEYKPNLSLEFDEILTVSELGSMLKQQIPDITGYLVREEFDENIFFFGNDVLPVGEIFRCDVKCTGNSALHNVLLMFYTWCNRSALNFPCGQGFGAPAGI